MAFILTVVAVAALLVGCELFWRRSNMHGEFSRKFIHITVGTFVASWPFFLSWTQILILSLAFIVGIIASKYLNLFTAIHSVQRPTLGELFFAISVGAIALVTNNPYIYAVALLQMSLADGFAAVVGTKYGNNQRYYIFGQAKSVIGTATFFIVSMTLLTAYSAAVDPLSFGFMMGVALLATAIENIGVHGTDNLLVPLLVAGFLASS